MKDAVERLRLPIATRGLGAGLWTLTTIACAFIVTLVLVIFVRWPWVGVALVGSAVATVVAVRGRDKGGRSITSKVEKPGPGKVAEVHSLYAETPAMDKDGMEPVVRTIVVAPRATVPSEDEEKVSMSDQNAVVAADEASDKDNRKGRKDETELVAIPGTEESLPEARSTSEEGDRVESDDGTKAPAHNMTRRRSGLNETTYEFDEKNRPVKVIHVDGSVGRISYEDEGGVPSTPAAQTIYEYDGAGNLIKTIRLPDDEDE